MSRIARSGLAVVIASGAVACAIGPHKTDAQRQVDRETVDRVQSALNADSGLYAKHIIIRADNGVVRLGGYVWTQPDLDEAQRIAEMVQGVTKVVNDMELERGGIDNSNVSR